MKLILNKRKTQRRKNSKIAIRNKSTRKTRYNKCSIHKIKNCMKGG